MAGAGECPLGCMCVEWEFEDVKESWIKKKGYWRIFPVHLSNDFQYTVVDFPFYEGSSYFYSKRLLKLKLLKNDDGKEELFRERQGKKEQIVWSPDSH